MNIFNNIRMLFFNTDKIIDLIREEIKGTDIKLNVHYSKEIVLPGNIVVGGYFSEKDKVIAFAVRKKKSSIIPLILHEFCHLKQYKYNSSRWLDLHDRELGDLDVEFDRWLNKEIEFTKQESDYMIDKLIAVELECEQWTSQLLKELNVPIDHIDYVKQANAYIRMYEIFKETRKFCDISPCDIKEILAIMPDTYQPLEWYTSPMTDKERATYMKIYKVQS